MPQNRATIYSNGVAELSRVFRVAKSEAAKISIPVRQQHLADVLASLNISGDVKIDSPPSYQPANVDDGNLTISPTGALLSMLRQLTGSQVSILAAGETTAGQLIGLQDQQVSSGGEPFSETWLVVLVDQAVRRIAVKDLESLEFTDPVIQAEINKALSRQLREIKPNSTFVDLELSTSKKETDAIIQYTIPAAAWKISYRLIILDNKLEFHGHAIVDNNTDEDWKDFIVSVVIGQPVTFTSDLADSKTPKRSHVDIVQGSAIGAVEVEEAELEMPMAAAPMQAMKSAKRGRFRSAGGAMDALEHVSRDKPIAQIDEAEVSEAGDFCIFQSQYPVSIDARRSAVIPVFQTELDESQSVLHYKRENHSERPFRAVRFKNTMEHSLGRGICTVFDEATYAGSCILPSLKSGEDTLLPHALDSSVKIICKRKPAVNRRIGSRISEGVVVETYHRQVQTEYHVKNSGKANTLILDHEAGGGVGYQPEIHLLRNDEDPVVLETKTLKSGSRVEVELLANDQFLVSIVESKTTSQKVHLVQGSSEGNLQVEWLIQNIVESNASVADDPKVQHCIGLHRELDEVHSQIEHANHEIKRLDKRQERLRKNLKVGGGDSQNQKWRTDLARTEDAIVQLEDDRLSELNTRSKQIRQALFDSLNELTLQWTE